MAIDYEKDIIMNIDVDFYEKKSLETIYTKQYDDRSRWIVATIWKDGEVYTIPENTSAYFACEKPQSGYGIFNPCEIVNNQILYEITTQTTSEFGNFNAEFRLYSKETVDGVDITKRLSSPNFKMHVEKAALNENSVISTPEFNVLTEALITLGELTDEVNEAIAKVDPALEKAELAVEDSLIALNNANTATAKANIILSEAATATMKSNDATANCNAATANTIEATENSVAATTACITETEKAKNAATLANQKADLANEKALLADQKATLANKSADNANIATAACVTATANANTATSECNVATTNAKTATAEADIAATRANTYANEFEQILDQNFGINDSVISLLSSWSSNKINNIYGQLYDRMGLMPVDGGTFFESNDDWVADAGTF